jgi:hypothetical protein
MKFDDKAFLVGMWLGFTLGVLASMVVALYVHHLLEVVKP